jgi:hypothetical protein
MAMKITEQNHLTPGCQRQDKSRKYSFGENWWFFERCGNGGR